jgi:putative nucleotidyltransferase with HDIG domain
MFNLIVKINSKECSFLEALRAAMEDFFGEDQRRIDHALQVSLYARELLSYIEADPVQTLAAAYLHDIGIPEAERKHGSSAGNFQEMEGPPIAEEILAKLGADESLVDAVANIVGNHHTPAAIDSAEFRVIWDADALVNFAGVLPGKTETQIESILQGHMVTEAGYRMARNIFLKDTESHKRCLTGHRPAILP